MTLAFLVCARLYDCRCANKNCISYLMSTRGVFNDLSVVAPSKIEIVNQYIQTVVYLTYLCNDDYDYHSSVRYHVETCIFLEDVFKWRRYCISSRDWFGNVRR